MGRCIDDLVIAAGMAICRGYRHIFVWVRCVIGQTFENITNTFNEISALDEYGIKLAHCWGKQAGRPHY